MADCTKTADFLRELNRMHEAFDECRNCPLSGWKREPSDPGCFEFVKHYAEQTIAIVQKWSDEHPPLTWAGKLKELLPNANIEDVIAPLCPRDFFGGIECPSKPGCDYGCERCWNGEYKEAP